MPTADEFRKELHAIFRAGTRRADDYVDVNAGQLHRDLGGYPGLKHQMPTCCVVMEAERRSGDVVMAAPPKGKGASLTIRYKLPR